MTLEKKNFYRSVVTLVLPLALQNLINVSVGAADVVMLGKVGETALSASSLAGQAYFVGTGVFCDDTDLLWTDFRRDNLSCAVLGTEEYQSD